MAYTSDGAPASVHIAAKASETVNGMTDQQKALVAVDVAKNGLTYAQAVAKNAPKVAASATAAHQAAITAVAATKTAAHPAFTELVQ